MSVVTTPNVSFRTVHAAGNELHVRAADEECHSDWIDYHNGSRLLRNEGMVRPSLKVILASILDNKDLMKIMLGDRMLGSTLYLDEANWPMGAEFTVNKSGAIIPCEGTANPEYMLRYHPGIHALTLQVNNVIFSSPLVHHERVRFNLSRLTSPQSRVRVLIGIRK